MLLLYINRNRYLIVRKPNTRFNVDITFVMEIAYDAMPLKRLRFFYAISTPSPIRARQCRLSEC